MLPLPLSATSHLLEVSHVAHRLSVSPEFARRLMRDGKLPGAFRLGNRWRIETVDLQAFIDAQRGAAKTDDPRAPDQPSAP